MGSGYSGNKSGKWLAGVTAIAAVILSGQAYAAIQFAPGMSYPTGSTGGPGPAAESMIAADVDNDGDKDVVAADWWGNGIRAFRNNGNGTFGPAIVTNLGGSTGSVSAAHFDLDGKIDLAVATGSQLVMLKGNGNGTFTEVERHTLTVSGQIQAYAFDVNLDGKPDVVAPTGSGIQVFLGQGNGRVVAGPLSAVSGFFSAAAKANLNNDGIPDLVVADAGSMQALALRGNGNGSFTQIGSGLVGLGPEDIAAGDVNGDGIDDVVTADSFSFTVSVLISDGQGGFAPAVRLYGNLGPVSLRLFDMDNDADLDIVESAVVANKVQVFPNNGSGTFGSPIVLSAGQQPQTPAVADYNFDGRRDIAVAGPNTMTILLNTTVTP